MNGWNKNGQKAMTQLTRAATASTSPPLTRKVSNIIGPFIIEAIRILFICMYAYYIFASHVAFDRKILWKLHVYLNKKSRKRNADIQRDTQKIAERYIARESSGTCSGGCVGLRRGVGLQQTRRNRDYELRSVEHTESEE